MLLKHDLIYDEESRLRVFENRILRRLFAPKRMRMRSGEGFPIITFTICTVHFIFRAIKSIGFRLEEGTGSLKIVYRKDTSRKA